jgi:hypothetical protein
LKGMAGTTGLEPAASAVTGQRSNQLNYVPSFTNAARYSIAMFRLDGAIVHPSYDYRNRLRKARRSICPCSAVIVPDHCGNLAVLPVRFQIDQHQGMCAIKPHNPPAKTNQTEFTRYR